MIDVAKGVEEQTEKLVEVCRMRNIPMIVFINKLDREGKDAFDLLDEVETKLKLSVTPLSFPIGMGYDFKGIYNIWEQNAQLFSGEQKQTISDKETYGSLEDPQLEERIGSASLENLKEELELVEGIYNPFDKEAYLEGQQQPVFFGSALNNFGVQELLDCFIEIAPEPLPKQADQRLIQPEEKDFSGLCLRYTPIWIPSIVIAWPLSR